MVADSASQNNTIATVEEWLQLHQFSEGNPFATNAADEERDLLVEAFRSMSFDSQVHRAVTY